MDDDMLEQRFDNIDRGLTRVEQILPTLATKEELRETRAELRHEIREAAEQSRRHMDVVAESLRSDIHLIAEHLAAEMSKRTGA